MDNHSYYNKILTDYLRAGQKAYFYQVAEFSKELMKQGVGYEVIMKSRLRAVKKINKNKRVYLKKFIDKSFTFFMEEITAYGIEYKGYINSRKEGYLAEIRELKSRLSRKLAMTDCYDAMTSGCTYRKGSSEEVLSSKK